jgi:hypothetical protein
VSPLDGYPVPIVEAGFTAGPAAIAAGNLVLDDVTLGKLDTGTLAAGTIWTDITAFVHDISVSRPGNRQQGPLVSYEAATATVTLNNSDARFSPDNLAGPYVSGGVTQIRPMIPLRIRITWAGITYPLFSGFTSSWVPPTEDFGAFYAQTVLTASDAFRVFEGITLATLGSSVGAGELAGARVSRILNAAGWYDPARGQRDIDLGISPLQGTTYGSSVLQLLQDTALSEIGEIYMDAQGTVVFRDRHAPMNDTRSNTVQAVFGDSSDGYGGAYTGTYGGMLRYSAVTIPCDDTTLANDVQATRAGGTLQEVTDAASIATYLFPRTYTAGELLLQTDTDTLQWASYVAYIARHDETRFDELTLQPPADPDNLWPHALGRDLGDRIQVWRQPPGMASPITRDCFIRGIYHTWNLDAGWVTTWTLQAASRYSFFTLGNATLGQLGSSALTF